jgi:hypothetical protein
MFNSKNEKDKNISTLTQFLFYFISTYDDHIQANTSTLLIDMYTYLQHMHAYIWPRGII